MVAMQKRNTAAVSIEFAQEALCRCVSDGNRGGIAACIEYFAAYTADGTTTLRQLRSEIETLLRRFCCLAVLAGEDIERTKNLADFYLDSIGRCEKRSDILVLFESCAEMFSAMVAMHRGFSGDEADFQGCRTYIQSRLTEELRMEDVAGHYGYHPAYFSRKFKQTFGVTFKQYMLGARLEHAAEELRSTRQSILEISEKYHFCSQSHFQNAFRERFGQTPRQYRQKAAFAATYGMEVKQVG